MDFVLSESSTNQVKQSALNVRTAEAAPNWYYDGKFEDDSRFSPKALLHLS
jgi:hypothetical protein